MWDSRLKLGSACVVKPPMSDHFGNSVVGLNALAHGPPPLSSHMRRRLPEGHAGRQFLLLCRATIVAEPRRLLRMRYGGRRRGILTTCRNGGKDRYADGDSERGKEAMMSEVQQGNAPRVTSLHDDRGWHKLAVAQARMRHQSRILLRSPNAWRVVLIGRKTRT